MHRFSIKSVRVLAIAALGIAAFPLAAIAQSPGEYFDDFKLPAGPAGTRITELIATINLGDEGVIRKFFETSVADSFRGLAPMEQHVAVLQDVHRRSGKLTFASVRSYDPPRPGRSVIVIAKSELTDGWVGLDLTIEESEPHRIERLGFSPARAPKRKGEKAKSFDEGEVAAALKETVERLAAADAFSGTVLLERNGKTLYSGAFGLASKRFGVANDIDTKFNLGSMNKMFTGVACGQLVERGKLSFDDPIGKYLSEDWLPREILDKVRVKHLLTHTSGLGSYFNDEFWNSSRMLYREVDDYKPLVRDETLAFEPGTNWQYSNTGMLLAGAVIEAASGQNYFAYVRENLFKPAGMKNTDSYSMDRPVPNLAIGYSREAERDGTEWENNIFKHVVRGGPAGGGFSTVGDLIRFAKALRSGKLVSSDMFEVLTTSKPDIGSDGYGYGFGVLRLGDEGERSVGHSGGFPGISAHLQMYLGSGFNLAVLSNYDNATSPIVQRAHVLIQAFQE